MATMTVDEPRIDAKARVLDAVEEAKRAIERGKHQFEDLRDNATGRIKEAPLASVGAGFAAGILLGALFGMVAMKVSKKEAKASAPCC